MNPEVHLVIFGASGDLATRKILPALDRLFERERRHVQIVGAGRSPQLTEHFRASVLASSGSEALASSAHWVQLDYAEPRSFAPLKGLLANAPFVVFYLATPADRFGDILSAIGNAGLAAQAIRRVG